MGDIAHAEVQGFTGEMGVITAPATEAAKQWEGWGTALKPALEPITVARKPLEGTVAANVLAHGTGALNIAGCRVGTDDALSLHGRKPTENGWDTRWSAAQEPGQTAGQALGRWPANLIHDGSAEVVGLFPETGKSGRHGSGQGGFNSDGTHNCYGKGDEGFDASGGYVDSGSAARFFYCAKASKADRDEGCEAMPLRDSYMVENGSKTAAAANGVRYDRTTQQRNHHPTVKPTALMRYLVRLVTPTNGTVLDPFMGSGSTGKAAIAEGFRFIGIERDPESFEIAVARCKHALAKRDAQLMLFLGRLDL
ncbi:MAG TPA: site-specific DNA-methyltransferase [Terracidiphilus sp.]|nr:site-specific DNA-methyltransferase [Terracidiphilus sp.]